MITVIGSINMDIVVETNLFPKQGETILGESFHTVPGGKGANQAVAAARLGAHVHMVGALGNDAFGQVLRNLLKVESVKDQFVETTSTATGIANIILFEQDNRIIVVPGANHDVTKESIDAAREQIAKSELVIMQLEIPQETVEYALDVCQELGVKVLLNPAPAENFKEEWMDRVAYFTPNETECADIFKDDVENALERYPNRLIVTLGADGARYYDGEKHVIVKGFKTVPKDTTGAGDTFNGAFAYALTTGVGITEAVKFANIAASLSVEKFGAQGGMPKVEAVQARLKEAR